eukprot:TRINITY_DN35268_c0_g1_i1.p1 TRINITY_DN35268_c0_g1~~TRINITY_DN35268_c0_g1_i1.p1  ORF type:complete len:457 (+),score=181.28 TRINITY_DN35268_c0_g1_i1:36-1373(+)
MVRHKIVFIFIFSMLGLLGTVLMDVIPHESHLQTNGGGNVYDNASENMKVVLLCLQLLITISTAVTLGLIGQYYHLLLVNKRKEWSGLDISPIPNYVETAEEKERRKKEQFTLVHAYSIWASSTFKYLLLLELLLHAVHPIVFISDLAGGSIFEACKIVVIMRLYLILRLLHFLSEAYRSRFEIVNQYDDLKAMNMKISQDFTLKSYMHIHTGWIVTVWSLMTVVVGGFGMYLIERDARATEDWVVSPPDWSGDIGNSLWFAFITATTIGYGDYYPSTLKGRLMACVVGVVGLFVVVVFKALLTNQLKPSKYEKYIKEYLGDVEIRESVQNAAVTLIQRVWRHKRATQRFGALPMFHKSNSVFCAIKTFREIRFQMRHSDSFEGASDVVLDLKMEQLMTQANQVGIGIQYQRDALLKMHRRVHKQLKSIISQLEERKHRRRQHYH